MCGIAGVAISTPSQKSELVGQLRVMADAMLHRGPDDCGVYVSPDGLLGLANRRLAIRDLSPAGHMPMSNSAAEVWITYNGELYNAEELRAELRQSGFRFCSETDTEVVLHGYEAWGDGVVSRLRGMFAFGIYDQRRRRLLLARDPLGIKPLFWTIRSGGFAFASECKALLGAGLARSSISTAGLVAYLALGSLPAPLTIYRDVRALEAGHTLAVELAAGQPDVGEPCPYWQLPAQAPRPIAYPDAVELVHAVLLDSIRRHLVSDVPIGVFLSGGIDSGSIATLAREANPSTSIRTCSVTFAERAFDEGEYARVVAAQLGTIHTEVPVGAHDVIREMDNVLAFLDQPSNDGINTYFVSHAARQAGLTVALSGVGGDELFGGYPTFARLPVIARALAATERIPGGRRAAPALLNRSAPFGRWSRLGGWFADGSTPSTAAYLSLRGLFSGAAMRQLVAADVLADAQADLHLLGHRLSRAAGQSPEGTPWDLTSRLELTTYMRHQLLRDSDVMSMAHSLEVRVPFVDVRVVDAVLGLPTAIRRTGLAKQLLRDAAPMLHPVVRNRRDKQGFTFPFQEWMAGPLHGPVRELIGAVLINLRGVLLPAGVESLLDGFDRGGVHWSRVWAIAALGSIGHN